MQSHQSYFQQEPIRTKTNMDLKSNIIDCKTKEKNFQSSIALKVFKIAVNYAKQNKKHTIVACQSGIFPVPFRHQIRRLPSTKLGDHARSVIHGQPFLLRGRHL